MLFGKKKTAPKTESATARTGAGTNETNTGEGLDAAQSRDDATTSESNAADSAATGSAASDSATTGSATIDSAAVDAADLPALSGPRDFRGLESKKGYLDFGALLIPAAKNQQVRLDIDQKTKRVVALTIMVEEATIQVQPFSAPKSGGTWNEVLQQIEESVIKQNGKVKQVDGRFGKELAARVPTTLKDGRKGWRVARFIGFEGPRWFLRGVVGGRGAIDASAARAVEELFSKIVVVRGDDPLPPRELLRLQPPEGAKRVVVPRNRAQRRDDSPSPNPAAAPVSDVS